MSAPFPDALPTHALSPSGQPVRLFKPHIPDTYVLDNAPEVRNARVGFRIRPSKLWWPTTTPPAPPTEPSQREHALPPLWRRLDDPAYVPPPPLARPRMHDRDGIAAAMDFLRERGERVEKSPDAMFYSIVSWILRFSARDLGYDMVMDGFVRVSDMLRYQLLRNYTLEQFADKCTQDRFQRFEVMRLPELIDGDLEDVWWVREKTGQKIPGVHSSNKRIINMGKLQTVSFRTSVPEWNNDIRLHGIREDKDRLIRLYQKDASRIFDGFIPRHRTYVCVTIDAQRASELGVKFFHTNTVELYAMGDRHRRIPPQAVRSVVVLNIDKEKLNWAP